MPADVSFLVQIMPVLVFLLVALVTGAILTKIKILGDSLWINLFVALGPVAYMKNVSIKFLHLIADADLGFLIKILGFKDFLPDPMSVLPASCKLIPGLCNSLNDFIFGKDPNNNINQTLIPVFWNHVPCGTSVLSMIHYSQGVKADVFQMFDYGKDENLKHYNQTTPPLYDISNMYYGNEIKQKSGFGEVIIILCNAMGSRAEPVMRISLLWVVINKHKI